MRLGKGAGDKEHQQHESECSFHGLVLLVYYILAGDAVEEWYRVCHALPDLVVGAVAVELYIHGETVLGEPDDGVPMASSEALL